MRDLLLTDIIHRGHINHRVSSLVILPHIPSGSILYMEPMDGTSVIIIRQPTIYATSMPAVRMFRNRSDTKCIMISSATIFGMLGDFDGAQNRTICIKPCIVSAHASVSWHGYSVFVVYQKNHTIVASRFPKHL
jgi:hypothetical protein